MPIAKINGVQINYELQGQANAPALVLSNSLGSNFGMWDAQMPTFAKTYRVLRYDTRGHGQSEVTPGPYTFEQLARDVLALADSLNIDTFHFCGLSMGGVTGMWLLSESHLTIHSFPEFGSACLNLFCCRERSALDWRARLTDRLGAKRVQVNELRRPYRAPE